MRIENSVGKYTFKVVLQNAYGRKYAWSYYLKEENGIVLSGAVYYSNYPSENQALGQIEKELVNRGIDEKLAIKLVWNE